MRSMGPLHLSRVVAHLFRRNIGRCSGGGGAATSALAGMWLAGCTEAISLVHSGGPLTAETQLEMSDAPLPDRRRGRTATCMGWLDFNTWRAVKAESSGC